MYVILGATGHTGSAIAEKLLAKGEKVRAIARSKERLAKLSGQGAEAFVGDVADSAFLTQAFDGARAVYFMVPPNPTARITAAISRELSMRARKRWRPLACTMWWR